MKTLDTPRVCEKLGARFVRVARIPEWNDLYKLGNRYENIFEWDIRHICPMRNDTGVVPYI